MNCKLFAVSISLLIVAINSLSAQEQQAIYPAAVFSFQERGSGVKGFGNKVADILFAELSTDPELFLVEREELQRILAEQEMSLSGMIAPGTATQVGQLTGAKFLITGSVIEADDMIYLVAKIIGTETGRVLGEKVKGRFDDAIGPLSEQLARKTAAQIKEHAGSLVAKNIEPQDIAATINAALGDQERPSLYIHIEERHIGQPTIDPAAETELRLLAEKSGFRVLDRVSGETPPDILITGEAFSEFAMRRGNFVCVKARVEIKATRRGTSTILASDRQTEVKVDLTELIAGKSALQKAAANIALRLFPKLQIQP